MKTLKRYSYLFLLVLLLLSLVVSSVTVHAVFANQKALTASSSWCGSLANVINEASDAGNTQAQINSAWQKFENEYPEVANHIKQDLAKKSSNYSALFTQTSSALDLLLSSVISDLGDSSTTYNGYFTALKNSGKASTLGYLSLYASAIDIRGASMYNALVSLSNRYVFVRGYQLGGSHYAYTEAVSDDTWRNERNFTPGSQLCILNVSYDGTTLQKNIEVLINDPNGVIRDPDVSNDGTKILYSHKKGLNNDDFHLYEMDIATKKIRQLTFGLGYADYEGQYLPDGNIVFNSTRCIKRVDCWITPVSNLYICDENGQFIRNVGKDQVHTNYPTVTEDGRVIYTRWDYNDRSQMYTQPLFQMNPDGTNQTEFFGNNSNFPTTLIHARNIPNTQKVMATATGHHTLQSGKLMIIDPSKGTNTNNALSYINEDGYCQWGRDIDALNQGGPQYKYPYPINENVFLCSYAPTGWAGDRVRTKFDIYLMDLKGNKVQLIDGSPYPATQIVPIKTSENFIRPSMVDYTKETGTYYIGNIYEGPGLKNIPKGTVKELRIISLEFRSSAIKDNSSSGVGGATVTSPVSIGNGSWDVKKVLGTVPIESDGSALFTVPARIPVYFQALDEKGQVVQTMRSWTTLMPNETYSCVGCHENKSTAPPANGTVSIAMKKGAQQIQPESWQIDDNPNYDPYKDYEGFSYTKEIQPILDRNCISCHDNQQKADAKVGSSTQTNLNYTTLISRSSNFKYTTSNPGATWNTDSFDDSLWQTGRGPFGASGTPPGDRYTNWTTSDLWIRSTFELTSEHLKDPGLVLHLDMAYDEDPKVYINGTEVLNISGSSYTTTYSKIDITSRSKSSLKAGTNTIAVKVSNSTGGQYIGFDLLRAIADTQSGDDPSHPFSLEDYSIQANDGINYLSSYLIFTGAKANNTSNINTNGSIVTWPSCMGGVEMLTPYTFGSYRSNLFKLLEENRNGHPDVDISDADMRALRAWNDLCVPFMGAYNERVKWDSTEQYQYTYNLRKRYSQEAFDNAMIDQLLQTQDRFTPSADYRVEILSFENNSLAEKFISPGSSASFNLTYKEEDRISVTSFNGEKYFYVKFDPLLPEQLIYAPQGYFEYKIPFGSERNGIPSGSFLGSQQTISVRPATSAELSGKTFTDGWPSATKYN